MKIIPSLKGSKPISYWIGVRPYRTNGIRLESEIFGNKIVVHNYGHSGSGVTLSHGCAKEVSEIIEKHKKSNL